MEKNKSKAAFFWEHFEEYICSFALVVMTIVTFINVLSRKIPSLQFGVYSRNCNNDVCRGFAVLQRHPLLEQILTWVLNIYPTNFVEMQG